MVAINSAIEVDLTGQVCADSIGPKLYSGVGGQLDFIYGASRSKGGIPIIALPSTTTLHDGTSVTRIATMLKQGAGVVTSRNHVRYVVTEYGIADLYGKTICERARQLINIAHPDFRADLEHQVIHRHRQDQQAHQAAHRDHQALQERVHHRRSPSGEVASARGYRAGVCCGPRCRAGSTGTRGGQVEDVPGPPQGEAGCGDTPPGHAPA